MLNTGVETEQSYALPKGDGRDFRNLHAHVLICANYVGANPKSNRCILIIATLPIDFEDGCAGGAIWLLDYLKTILSFWRKR